MGTLFAACGGGGTTGDAGSTDAGGGMDGHADTGTAADAHTDAPAVDAGPVDAPPADANCTTPDGDGDGHAATACGGDDCNDADPNEYPGHPEVCDAAGHDEDCNPATLGPDGDGDGFPATTCCNTQPSGTLLCGGDCDDTRATVNPSAAESCNGIDDNCNGMTDEGVTATCYTDADGDGYARVGAVGMMMCTCPTGTTATAPATAADCDDANSHVNPAVPEICNGVDDNCNGMTDEGVGSTYYRDLDHDGQGSSASGTIMACSLPSGYTTDNTDCNDMCAACYVGATEVCDGRDNDCNGLTDEVLGATCSVGNGACARTGRVRCDASCSATPGAPDTAFHTTVAPNGSWDWNCDGTVSGLCTNVDPSVHVSANDYCMSVPTPGCYGPIMCGLTSAPGPGVTIPYCGQPVWYYGGATLALATPPCRNIGGSFCAVDCCSGIGSGSTATQACR